MPGRTPPFRADRAALALGAPALALGCVVMFGWIIKAPVLTQIVPRYAAMQFNTALCLSLGGAGLVALARTRLRWAQGAAVAVLLVAGLTLLQYPTGLELGLDQLFVDHYLSPETSHAGRMSVPTALCFLLTSCGLLGSARRWSVSLIATLASLAVAISLTAFVAYLLNLHADYGWLSVTRMALHTAFGMLLVGCGVLGYVWGSANDRVPTWLAVPIGLGSASFATLIWIAIDGHRDNPTDVRGEVGVLLLVMTLLFASMITITLRLIASRGQRARDLAETAQALAESNTRLAHSNKKLQRFAWVASHDLQEPLRKIPGFLNVLERRLGPALDDKNRKFLDLSIDAAERMQVLIQEVLAWSQMQADRADAPVDLNDAMAEALELLSRVSAEAGVVIEAPPLPTVRGDRRQLVQLLQNLLSNAIKYRRPNAQLTVEIMARAADGWLELAIRDNGIGIAPQYHAQIFEAFTRLHGRGTYPGTGIGLAMCQEIAERHGGTLRVESAEGDGSTFIVRLPIAG